MTKLKITLTLTDAEAEHLVATIALGAKAWYGAGLMRDASTLHTYVAKRYDAAVTARGAARRRQDQRKLATEALMTRVRGMNASVTPEQRASNDHAFASLADEAAAMIRQIRSEDDAKV